jgi:hypothetical protein
MGWFWNLSRGGSSALARAVLAALPAGLIALGGCGFSHAAGVSSRPGSSLTTSVPQRVGGEGARVLLRGLENPQAYAAGDGLYVARQVTPPGDRVLSELMRVDPISGQVRAVRRLGSAFDQALLAERVLWVTTTGGGTSWLWRLDPGSLRVWSRDVLPGLGATQDISVALALAGGWLWVGSSDRLDRVSLLSGHVTAQVVVSGAGGVDVAADPSGRVLLDSEGNEPARVQRRDPHTGALIASSGIFAVVTRPYIGGIAAGGVWISEAGGMMGAVERLSLLTLRPTRFPGAQPHGDGELGPPRIEGTNGIGAQLIAGVLWVTQQGGGAQRNYCGDPSTGRALAPLPLGQAGELLAADHSRIYYVPDASSPRRDELAEAPINPRCRGAQLTRFPGVRNPQQSPYASFECAAASCTSRSGSQFRRRPESTASCSCSITHPTGRAP